MSDLLSDFLNDRLEPVPIGGVINGVMDCGKSDDEEVYNDSDSEFDEDYENYEPRELLSYVPKSQEVGGLSDIIDGREESILGSEFCDTLTAPKVFDQYKFDTYYKRDLQIDSFKEKILDNICANSVVVIQGPTGCGKTTQVPQYILDQCRATKSPCNIVVTQPRRIAAINIAQRVCEERGWAIGTVCGYQVGLDKNVGEDVILTYMTTEVLLQKLILQKNLNKFTHIILDEVHERSKTLDFLLLIVRKYLFTNSQTVKVILMSATMEAKDFAYYFRSVDRNNSQHCFPAPIVNVGGTSGYLTTFYYNQHFAPELAPVPYKIDDPYIHPEQYQACLKLLGLFDKLDEEDLLTNKTKIGSVLVFLPGFHEIEEMSKLLVEKKNSQLEWEIIPLHSSLTNDHMIKAFQKPKPGVRKIILSTNIAESSVTVPDVNYVIDFCLTKIMTVNEFTKFSTLSLQWASHNNCIQRAGRVGRVANGRVYRVVPKEFYDNEMQPNSVPEMQRAPLENIILYMKLLDLNDTPKNVLSLAMSPPNLKDVETCVWHLKEVGALLQTCRGKRSAADGDLTFLGRIMGSLPIDIRLAKMIVLGHMFCCLEETIIMAAGCMTKNLFVHSFHDRFKCYRKKLLWADGSSSDFMILLNLYNVWLKSKRENAFRTLNEEYAWCKTNFVNLKGLREWDILIKEINNRLRRLNIEKPVGALQLPITPSERATLLKVIICGAFYPNYFVRSSDYGQVDGKEAVRVLSGRDPRNTVYFTNMKPNQPGQIYVRQIKKLLRCENNQNVQIGFDGQSSKVFVEFKNVKQPESIMVDGRQYITTIPVNIAVDVYEAVRKRQLNIPFRLELLPDHKAWEFANSTEAKLKSQNSAEAVNCFTNVNYSPLPPLDLEYMTVIVTHIEDAGHFYCQNWNDETRMWLDRIFMALNGPGIFLEPVTEKVSVNGKIYAAMFNEDGKFYRCRVLCIIPGTPPYAQVIFIDYGNVQRVPINRLYNLPEKEECYINPVAMCCVLSEIQPANISGVWDEKANENLRRKTEGVLLNAKVYSVVEDIVHLELYRQSTRSTAESFNQWLINERLGQKSEESYLSKVNHQKRQEVLNSENPFTMSSLLEVSNSKSYTDYEAPSSSETVEIIDLRGPFSPLEMKVCGLVRACQGSMITVEGDSVNAVLLDDNPEDPHTRLLVAAHTTQSAITNTVKLSQTTIMPAIPGFPMLMTLLFCPQMEAKPTPDGTRIASILCGLGRKELSDRANYPMHDISLVLDTDLSIDMINMVNRVRHLMSRSLKTISNICDEISFDNELYYMQKNLKNTLFNLLGMQQKSVDKVDVKNADVWNKSCSNDLEILTVERDDDPDEVWPLLWFYQLNSDKEEMRSINKNLQELSQIAKRLVPEKEIICELCNSATLRTVGDVRVHLFRDQHKQNLAKLEKK